MRKSEVSALFELKGIFKSKLLARGNVYQYSTFQATRSRHRDAFSSRRRHNDAPFSLSWSIFVQVSHLGNRSKKISLEFSSKNNTHGRQFGLLLGRRWILRILLLLCHELVRIPRVVVTLSRANSSSPARARNPSASSRTMRTTTNAQRPRGVRFIRKGSRTVARTGISVGTITATTITTTRWGRFRRRRRRRDGKTAVVVVVVVISRRRRRG